MNAQPFLDDVRSIPFRIPDHDGTTVETLGIARLGEGEIILEWQDKAWNWMRASTKVRCFVQNIFTESATMPVDEEETRTVSIPFSRLEYLRWRNWFFWGSIKLEVDSLKLLNAFPGNKGNMVYLLTRFGDRERGRRFVSQVNMSLADWRIAHADSPDNDIRDFDQSVGL